MLAIIANPILTLALVTCGHRAAVILSAMPVGANPYIIAQQYNVHVETVPQAIIFSTGMSVFTISSC